MSAWWKSEKCPAPEGVKEPLHWKLLTSLPCATLAQVLRVVGRYTAQLVDRRISQSPQERRGSGGEPVWDAPTGWRSLIAILAVVAVRLLGAVSLLARAKPGTV